jgi:transposase-like protein
VPQDRHGRFSTELFERYQRSEWNERSKSFEMKLETLKPRLEPALGLSALGGP